MRRSTMGAVWRDFILSVLLIVWCGAAAVAQAQCLVRLEVVNTQLTFAGSSSASLVPGEFPVKVAGDEGAPKLGLTGSMYLHLPGASTCPTTEQGWLDAASKMQLTSAPSSYHYKPLSLYPPILPLEVMGVPLNISDLQLNTTLSSKGPAPASATRPFKMAVNATITHGFVYSNTPLTGGAQLQPMGSANSISTSKALLNLTKGPDGDSASQLNIVLPEFKLSFSSKTFGVVGGRAWSGTLSFSFTGALYLTALVGCPSDCGAFGRCIAVNTTAAAAAAAKGSAGQRYACECECGWSIDPASGRCDAPSGTCPLFPSSSSAVSTALMDGSSSRSLNSSGSSSSGCSGGEAVAASGGTCPAKYGFDVFSKTCTPCQDGWGGPGCKLCATDEACRVKTQKSNAICNTGVMYNERSQAKYYACRLSDPTVAKIVGPVLPLTCTTGGGKPDKPSSALAVSDSSLLGSSATCSIAMRLVGMPQGTSAMCTATGCHFAAGNPSFVCDGVVCGCPSGCPPAYLKTFRDVSGAVTLDCDATGETCAIVLGSLNMKIKASCEASECLDPSGPKLVGSATARRAGPPVAPPVVAALPLLALVLAGLACAAALAHYWPYLHSRHHQKTAAAGPAAAAGPIAEGLEEPPLPAAAAAAAAATGSNGGRGSSSSGSGSVTPRDSPLGPGHGPVIAAVHGGGAAAGSGSALNSTASTVDASLPLPPLTMIKHSPSQQYQTPRSSSSGTQIHELSFYDITADVKIPVSWKQLATAAVGGCCGSNKQQQQEQKAGGSAGDVEQGPLTVTGKSTGRIIIDDINIKVDSQHHQTDSDSGKVIAVTTNTDDYLSTAPLPPQQQQQQPSPLAAAAAGSNGSWRRVLQGVSGCVGSGEVLGIMGPSGGGKSTLLMKLCGGLGGHSRGGEWRSGGVVCLDGVAAPPSLLTAVTALVPQDDSLMRSLTVEECIRYSAALRLEPSLPPAAVNGRVEGVLEALGLTKIRRSTVLSGTGVSGVSGGERRRVAIAMELVIDPQVLVLDEPLSGLDSYTALQLMRSLQGVAASGRVVALSLHQPSPALFGAMDNAMLLAGGVLVYSGPPAAAADALARLGCPVPQGITVAEHLLHVVSDPASLRHVVAAAAAAQQQQQAARQQGLPLLSGAASIPLQQQQQQGTLIKGCSDACLSEQQQQHDAAAGEAAATLSYWSVHATTTTVPATSHVNLADLQAQQQQQDEQQQQQLQCALTAHATQQEQRCPAHMQAVAAATAASLAVSGLVGPAAAAAGDKQVESSGAAGKGQASIVFAQQPSQQQPLSPKPSWHHRISALKPLKGSKASAASRLAQGSPAAVAAAAAAAAPAAYAGSVAGSSKAARLALGLPKQQRPFSRQVGVLFWRGLLDMLRNPLLTAFHALGGLVLGLLVGIIFFSVKSDTSGAQNRVGAIFFALCLLAFTSVTSVDLVQAESSAAGREMQRRYYSPVAYALTKLVLDGLLLRALPALLFGVPFYFLMGLNAAAMQVFVFLLVLIAFSATVGALALGFASALDSPGKTILVMNLVLLLGVLFGGFLANKGSIPAWLRWISWLSVFRYSWETLVINELSGLDLFLSAPGVSLSLPVKGEVFLQIIGVDSHLFLLDIGVLVAMYGTACLFVFAVLAWRHRVRNS